MIMRKRGGLPEHLSKIWDDVEPTVYPVIGPVGLEALCGQVHRQRDAEQRITEEGLVVQDSKGNPVPHPAIVIEKQAQAEIRQWLLKYGRNV